MAQTKTQIQELLASLGRQPKHRFGQNFMIDQNLLRLVADAGMVSPGDLVVEVGPGTGTLTDELLARGAEVIAVEIDRDLAQMLRQRFADQPRFCLIEGDALSSKHALNEQLVQRLNSAPGRPRKLIANLPYNIASPLIIEALRLGVDLLAFTVQKEVAERLRAPAGTEAYGPLSVMAQLLGKVEILRTLPPQAFWPAPKIESALVRIIREDQLKSAAGEFGRFVSRLFSFRRKTLRKALSHAGIAQAEEKLARVGIDPNQRPEELNPAQLRSLYQAAQH